MSQSYERAAKEIYEEFPTFALTSRSGACIDRIAAILAKHFPAPSAATQTRPDAVGCYECRRVEDEEGVMNYRVYRFWDGSQLFASPEARDLDRVAVGNYTDFIGPLVPAASAQLIKAAKDAAYYLRQLPSDGTRTLEAWQFAVELENAIREAG